MRPPQLEHTSEDGALLMPLRITAAVDIHRCVLRARLSQPRGKCDYYSQFGDLKLRHEDKYVLRK